MQSGQSKLGSTLPAAAEVPPQTPGGSLFRREGEYWTIAYHGTVIRLRDQKGLRYLAYLLQRPGQRVTAGDLMTAAYPAPSRRTSGARGERSGNGSQKPEAGDQKPPSDEHLRLAVTKRIKAAVARIHEHHPALGYHLSTAIKTGHSCIYLPDPERPVAWTV